MLGRLIGNPSLQPSNFFSASFGTIVSGFLRVVFFIAGFLMLFWLSWAVFQYIFASGDKEKLAKARARITWAIVGFLITVIAFALSEYAQQIFPLQNVPLTEVTVP